MGTINDILEAYVKLSNEEKRRLVHQMQTLDHQNEDHKLRILLDSSQDTTDYLLASPKNAQRLKQSIIDLKAGKVIQRGLIEE